jgi:RND family efflux transporter MFP subunit
LTGLTLDEVGRALGLSKAGVKKRLERGRALLRAALDRRGFGPTATLAAAAIALPATSAALAMTAADLAVRFVTHRETVPIAVLSLLSTGVRPMVAKIAFGSAVLLGIATTVGFGVLHGGFPDRARRSDDIPFAGKAMPPEIDPDQQLAQHKPRSPAGDETPRKSPPPPRPTSELDRFRALDPAERLKLIEKLAAGKAPFTATRRGNLLAAVVERGAIEAALTFDVVCRVKAKDKDSSAATTIKWLIDEGSMVKKGDRIAQLDEAAIVEQLNAATVKVKEAEAAMVLATENARLVQQESDVETRLAEIDVKLVEVELKDSPMGKVKEILELKAEQAKLKLERARARARAQQAHADAEKRAKVAFLDTERKRQSNIEAELKECVLLAPADGMVNYFVPSSNRFGGATVIAPGEPVREGQKLLRIADLKQFVLAIRVHEAQVSTVRVGQTTQVRVDAFPNKLLRGKVTQVSPIASAADWRTADIKVYPVTIAIEDAPPGLKPGMSGEAQIETAEHKAVLQVPLTAVVGAGRDRLCFVKSGQELLERKVVTGASNSTSVEIKEGLKEGDLVVASPQTLLGRTSRDRE